MTPELDADLDIEAPEAEGNGYFQGKTLQWADLCPHMGNPEKSLLRTLTNLTTKRSRSRRLRPDELRQMVYTGPVKVGEEPKLISHSGLLRLLRNLASIGQITDRDGGMLRFSSWESARSRAITMTVWRYPRHECGCQRNVFDALDVIRGEAPKWKPASVDESALHRPTEADRKAVPESLPGQEVNLPGQEVNLNSQGDQRKPAPPLSLPYSPPSSSSSSGGSTTSPAPQDPGDDEEDDDTPTAKKTPDAAETVMARTDATAEEAEAVVDAIETEVDDRHTRLGTPKVGQIDAYVARFGGRDLRRHLKAVRAQRASQARTGTSRSTAGQKMCIWHSAPTPCQACRIDLNAGGPDAEEIVDLYTSLGSDAAQKRPDLATHPTITAISGAH